MAKITQQKAIELSKPCKNGFVFDPYHYVIHGGEKQLVKSVYLNDEHTCRLQCSIYYRENYDWRTDTKTLKIIANIDKSRLNNEKTFWCGGMGIFIEHEYKGTRKEIKGLYPFTEIYTDDEIKKAWTDKGYPL